MAFKDYNHSYVKKETKQESIADENREEAVVEGTMSKLGKVYNCDKVYLRESPSKGSIHLDILDHGEELFINGEVGDWYSVSTSKDTNGYVMKAFVQLD